MADTGWGCHEVDDLFGSVRMRPVWEYRGYTIGISYLIICWSYVFCIYYWYLIMWVDLWIISQMIARTNCQHWSVYYPLSSHWLQILNIYIIRRHQQSCAFLLFCKCYYETAIIKCYCSECSPWIFLSQSL